jgi:hypothetical protein
MSSRPEPLVFVIAPGEAFAAVREPSAEALLGDRRDSNLVSRGGTVVVYGDGGAGKTTLVLDGAFHLCAGVEWLGLPVERCRVLWIENEGPRGGFRDKLEEKYETWDGPPLEGRLHVLEEPWARVSLADPDHRAALAGWIVLREIDVLVAGPVQRLGVEGGGTPGEVAAFVAHIEELRALVGRPLAVVLIHHENKAGDISGAWEGVTDTTAHVTAFAHGTTRVCWQKVRWGAELHGTTWHLQWRPGEQFEREEKPMKKPADVLEADLLQAARELPGASWTKIRKEAGGNSAELVEARDRLLEAGQLVNGSTRKGGFNLWAGDDPNRPDLQLRTDTGTSLGTDGTEPVPASSETPRTPIRTNRSPRKENGVGTERFCGGEAAPAHGDPSEGSRARAAESASAHDERPARARAGRRETPDRQSAVSAGVASEVLEPELGDQELELVDVLEPELVEAGVVEQLVSELGDESSGVVESEPAGRRSSNGRSSSSAAAELQAALEAAGSAADAGA